MNYVRPSRRSKSPGQHTTFKRSKTRKLLKKETRSEIKYRAGAMKRIFNCVLYYALGFYDEVKCALFYIHLSLEIVFKLLIGLAGALLDLIIVLFMVALGFAWTVVSTVGILVLRKCDLYHGTPVQCLPASVQKKLSKREEKQKAFPRKKKKMRWDPATDEVPANTWADTLGLVFRKIDLQIQNHIERGLVKDVAYLAEEN